MKLLINQKEFAKGLRIVKDVCNKRSLQPILSTVLIETVDGGIKVYGTNIDESIVTSVEAKVEQQGKVCVNAEKLFEIVNCIDSPIELETSGEYLHIRAGKSKFKIMFINESEYPKLDFINEGDVLSLDAKAFKRAIKNVMISVANDNNNVLGGVCFTAKDEKLELASTDGNRLSVDSIECSNADIQIVVPKNVLLNIIKNDFENIEIIANDKFVTFMADNTIYKSNLLNGQYPKYQQLIPQNTNFVAIDKMQLLKAIERVGIMVNEKTNIVKLMFKADNLMLVADNVESGNAEESLDIDYKQEDLTIAFNYAYMLDFLRTTQSDVINVELKQALSPTIFRGEFVYLLMPIQIK